MTFSEYMQLKEIAEAPDIGCDLVQFHEDAIGNFLAYMDDMEAYCENLSETIESRIKEVTDDGND